MPLVMGHNIKGNLTNDPLKSSSMLSVMTVAYLVYCLLLGMTEWENSNKDCIEHHQWFI